MSPPLAHVGHWAINLLYIAPLLIVLGVLAAQSRRDRRRIAREGGERARRPPEPGA